MITRPIAISAGPRPVRTAVPLSARIMMPTTASPPRLATTSIKGFARCLRIVGIGRYRISRAAWSTEYRSVWSAPLAADAAHRPGASSIQATPPPIPSGSTNREPTTPNTRSIQPTKNS